MCYLKLRKVALDFLRGNYHGYKMGESLRKRGGCEYNVGLYLNR
jgi:hypothetical protein